MGRFSGPLHIGSGTRIDAKEVVNVKEKCHRDYGTGLECRRLGATGGGVAAEAGVGLDYPELDKGWKHNLDRFTPIQQDRNDHPVLEEATALPELFLVHCELIETLRVRSEERRVGKECRSRWS